MLPVSGFIIFVSSWVITNCHCCVFSAICFQATSSYIDATRQSDEELQTVLVSAAERLALVITDKFQKFDSEEITRMWFATCEEAVSAVFRLHPTPDVFLGKMILSAYTAWAAATSSGAPDIVIKCRLARFMFLCGQGALSLLLYTENIANNAKKALEIKDKSKREDDKAKKDASGQGISEVDDMEEEMGLTAMADAEHEREFNTVVEVELVANPDNLLGTFHPFIAFVVANSGGEYSDPLVREAAILALCRYMSVSSVLCEEYLPLLFTVLERETNAAIRTSIVIATGDLSFRFPNAVEPWTARMYDRLSDECLLVRYNTLMVLTHLILNDMIKVKGQVSAVVMCLNDSSEQVCSLARLFFTELSKRSNNPVYNLLGDVISTLSRDNSTPVLEESTIKPSEEVVKVALVADSNAREHRELSQKEFHTTMHFLLSFVTKDKQADSLLERLLVRMAAAVSLKQRRNLAFCISELPITDKGVKRMTELLRQMKDCLFDKDIVESLKLVVAKAKKTTTKATGSGSEVKEAATEFNDFVKSVVEENSSDDVSGENVLPLAPNSLASTTGAQKKKAVIAKKTTATKRKPKKVVEESSDDDSEEESDGEDMSDEGEFEEESAAVEAKKRGTSAPSKHGLRC